MDNQSNTTRIRSERTVFAQILFILAGMGTLMMIFVSSFFLGFNHEKAQERSFYNYQRQTDSASQYLDSVLTSYHELLVHMGNSSTFFKYSLLQSNNSLKPDVLSQLALSKATHLYIDDIWYYAAKKDQIFTSGYAVESSNSSTFTPILSAYLEDKIDIHPIFYNEWHCYLFRYGERIFLCREFPINNASVLGMLFVELDMEQISADLLENLGSDCTFTILDGTYAAVASSPEQLDGPSAKQFIEAGQARTVSRSAIRVMSYSELSGWYLVVDFPNQTAISFWEVLPYLAAILLGIVLCFAACARFISYRFIQPLQRILSKSEIAQALPEKNELLKLSKSISLSEQAKLQSHTTLQSISAKLSSYLFYALCDGRNIKPAEMESTLREMNSKIDLMGIYWVAVFSYRSAASKQTAVLACNAITDYLNQTELQGIKFHVETYSEMTLVVYEIERRFSPSQIDQIRQFLFSNMVQALAKIDPMIDAGLGTPVYSLNDLSGSFSHAISVSTFVKDSQERPIEIQTGGDTGPEEAAFERIAQKMLQQIKNQQTELAVEDLKHLIGEMEKREPDPANLKPAMGRLLLAVFREAESLGFGLSRHGKTDLVDSIHNCPAVGNESFSASICKIFAQTFEQIENISRKKTNRTFVAATNYIRLHFQDSNLSLSVVAEAVKTNPSYLSKLFKASSDKSFLDCVNAERINYAKKLLEATDLPVQEISAQSGFCSEQTFYRTFKKMVYQTPLQYRKNNRK